MTDQNENTQIQAPKKVPEEKMPPPPPPKGRSKALIWFTIALVAAALLWFCYWLFYLRFHEYTDDAYANGNMINLNSAISGSVVAFFADDTDLVIEGQLLVQLDDTDYTIIYDRELAALAAVVLQVKQLYDNVLANQANAANKKIVLERANYDYENRLHLVASQAISNEEFIHARDELLIAQFEYKQAEYELKMAQDAVGETSIDKHPRIEEQKCNVRNAYYNLQHCKIYAPATGYVAQRRVDVGHWVAPSTNMLAIIPTGYVWVDANFKETQLGFMRIGQPATVWFDIYGSRVEFQGKVLGIASGTGSIFSLIPPQNATGNWIKIVQRLPVRISLEADKLRKFPPRLGISAEVDVDITRQDLPRLAQVVATKPVCSTTVFDLDMERVDLIIDQIIADNLKKENR